MEVTTARQKRRFGVEFSRIGSDAKPYMDRYIAFTPWFTLRAHKIYRGDGETYHDHPFWFVTFPLASYRERACIENPRIPDFFKEVTQIVRAWNFHFRPAVYRHSIQGRADGLATPFWTLVISGPHERTWGFWPNFGTFVPWRQYQNENRDE